VTERANPQIAVVTTTFNRAHVLPRAWDSLKNESVSFEWIVVDDKSTDDTAAVIAALGDPRIRYFKRDVNSGGPAAGRNQGALASRAPYVLFLDDDDELFPGALSRMLEVFENADPTIGCVLFQCRLPGGGQWGEPVRHGAVYDEVDVVCRHALGMEKICVYRRAVFDEFLLPEDLLFGEGVFVLGLSRRYKYLMLDEPGRVYHHDSGIRYTSSATIVRMSPLIARMYERILENHSEVLARHPEARLHYLLKAMFRYSVGRSVGESWRIFREVLRHRRLGAILYGLGLLALGLSGAGPLLERVRLPWTVRRTMRRAQA
jgi:glycosyltransferase involved in cell wall biosynthesis